MNALLKLRVLAVAVGSAAATAAPFVTVVESMAEPVISREAAAAAGVLGGFETGTVARADDGALHLFYGEKSRPTTYSWKMGWTDRVGHCERPQYLCRASPCLVSGPKMLGFAQDDAVARFPTSLCPTHGPSRPPPSISSTLQLPSRPLGERGRRQQLAPAGDRPRQRVALEPDALLRRH